MNNGEIILYQSQDGNIKIDVRLENENVWLTQAQMGVLFGKSRTTVTEHIQNIFTEGELNEDVVCRKFRHATQHGAIIGKTQEVATNYYNLDVIISVGYRVKSQQGTQFRIWATQRLKEYIIKGFTLNDERFKSGNSMNYFNELQERLREIRISERFFYQKIKDIYKTSIDYDQKNEKTVMFFKIVQNKLLWAISQQTAAELVYRRVDAGLPLLGMSSYDKKSEVSVKKSDVGVAKNYLTEDEIKLLGLIVEQYLAFAETMAQQHIPMYMKDWVERLDLILQMNGREILNHAGKISHELAMQKAENEFEKYKKTQYLIEREQSLIELEEDIKQLKIKKIMKKSVVFLSILIFFVSCKNNERKISDVKNLSEYPQTEFLLTMENEIANDKNAVYCATMLLAWNEIRNEINKPFQNIQNADLLLLNNSKSFINALNENEYSADVTTDNNTISAKVEFKKSLPFVNKLSSYNNWLSFDNTKVQSFGISSGDDRRILNEFKILYYKNDSLFVIKLFPKDKNHEIILFKPEKEYNSIGEMYKEVTELIAIGNQERGTESQNWKYTFNEEDYVNIPKINFNIETDYNSLIGSNFFAESQEYIIQKARQRTAFLFDEKGAEVESEVEVDMVCAEEIESIAKPKYMKFDKPFFILLKRTNADFPYFALWVANAELLVKSEK